MVGWTIKPVSAEIRMISGCKDSQTSADCFDVASFQLPDPDGKAGGACTSALLQVLYQDHKIPSEDLSFQEVLLRMRDVLQKESFEQIPQLTSTRCLDIHAPFRLVPHIFTGTRRAVIIGINYQGQYGELRGCHNDALNVKEYIMDVHGFTPENIEMLMDDGVHREPTRENILNAFRELAERCEEGDACFVHYSGHGGYLADDNNDEDDGNDETLIPVDFRSTGQILDDDVYTSLVSPMKPRVLLTSVMDCCHSGTVLDLPYQFKADGKSKKMELQNKLILEKTRGLEMIVNASQKQCSTTSEPTTTDNNCSTTSEPMTTDNNCSTTSEPMTTDNNCSTTSEPMTTDNNCSTTTEPTTTDNNAEVRMISGCKDSQYSSDCGNISQFQLPDPAGMAGGACTSALLKVLYDEHRAPSEDLSFQEVLLKMRVILLRENFDQIPQLTSTGPLDIDDPFRLTPKNFSGRRRAVIIGINYIGQYGELRGCHNDALHMKDYLMDIHGFQEKDIAMLLDDGKCIEPTRKNILNAFQVLAEECQEGDAAFVHYSGHGGSIKDDTGDEADGNDETLIPVDFRTTSQIRDDDVNATLVSPMKSGVLLTCVIDACHSGTVLDLPYQYKADGKSDKMVRKQSSRHLRGLSNYGSAKSLPCEENRMKDLPNHGSAKSLPCTAEPQLRELPNYGSVKSLPCTGSMLFQNKEIKHSEDNRSPVDIVWKDVEKKADRDAPVSSEEDEGSWSTVLKYCSLEFDKMLCGAIPCCQ